MFTRILRARQKEEGFTLIELLVVIIIIGILAAIAIPVFLNQRQKAWNSAVQSDLRNAATAEETVLTDCGIYTNLVIDVAATACTPGVVGTNKALGETGFKYSNGANYDGGVAAITATAVLGTSYCLTATSASGTDYEYDSATGLAPGDCT